MGRWMTRAPSTPKQTRPPHTPPRTHRRQGQHKLRRKRSKTPQMGLKMHTRGEAWYYDTSEARRDITTDQHNRAITAGEYKRAHTHTHNGRRVVVNLHRSSLDVADERCHAARRPEAVRDDAQLHEVLALVCAASSTSNSRLTIIWRSGRTIPFTV